MQWTFEMLNYSVTDESCIGKTATPLAVLPAVTRCQGPACLGEYAALKPARGFENVGG